MAHTSTTSTGRLDPWQSADLQHATQGTWYQGNVPTQNIERILTDSRQAQAGDAFLALKGERFDAHDFIEQVTAQGASCVIVERAIEHIKIPQLVVADTRLALGALGAYRRQQCTDLKMIALTGSSGKTTTKEMLGSILSQLGATLVTRGNLNNDLGVPMMLLELRQDHRFAVMELGANHIGEIDYTSQLVRSDVAGIINIGTAHLGEFGGRDHICMAKSEIYAHIADAGIAIIPCADDYVMPIREAASRHSQLGFGQGGEVYAEHIILSAQSSEFDLVTPQGRVQIKLPFAGEHNVHNAEAAAAFALALGVGLDDIATGLAHAVGAKGRLNFIQHQHCLFIDDTYNANPTSMRAAAEVLSQQHGVKVMVMGDIGELGDQAYAEHFALGQNLAVQALDYIVAVGEFAPAIVAGAKQAHVLAHIDQQQALLTLLKIVSAHQAEPMSFLFKGSRYTHMEHLLSALMENI